MSLIMNNDRNRRKEKKSVTRPENAEATNSLKCPQATAGFAGFHNLKLVYVKYLSEGSYPCSNLLSTTAKKTPLISQCQAQMVKAQQQQ